MLHVANVNSSVLRYHFHMPMAATQFHSLFVPACTDVWCFMSATDVFCAIGHPSSPAICPSAVAWLDHPQMGMNIERISVHRCSSQFVAGVSVVGLTVWQVCGVQLLFLRQPCPNPLCQATPVRPCNQVQMERNLMLSLSAELRLSGWRPLFSFPTQPRTPGLQARTTQSLHS
jgi:hypothetical protein